MPVFPQMHLTSNLWLMLQRFSRLSRRFIVTKEKTVLWTLHNSLIIIQSKGLILLNQLVRWREKQSKWSNHMLIHKSAMQIRQHRQAAICRKLVLLILKGSMLLLWAMKWIKHNRVPPRQLIWRWFIKVILLHQEGRSEKHREVRLTWLSKIQPETLCLLIKIHFKSLRWRIDLILLMLQWPIAILPQSLP